MLAILRPPDNVYEKIYEKGSLVLFGASPSEKRHQQVASKWIYRPVMEGGLGVEHLQDVMEA